MYDRSVVDASIGGQPVVQPTAQQMLRYWQAYLSVKDSQYPHLVQRNLSIRQSTVQIRLSVLASTIALLVLGLTAALVSYFREPRNQAGKRLHLPSSQLDWTVQAAREYYRLGHPNTAQSPRGFAAEHNDLIFTVSPDPNGESVPFISSPHQQNRGLDDAIGAWGNGSKG
jgi:hypothetical protein